MRAFLSTHLTDVPRSVEPHFIGSREKANPSTTHWPTSWKSKGMKSWASRPRTLNLRRSPDVFNGTLSAALERLAIEAAMMRAGAPIVKVDQILTAVRNNLGHLNAIRVRLISARRSTSRFEFSTP